jgi:hypothetical protein
MLVRGGMPARYARRNPDSLVPDYCAKRLGAPVSSDARLLRVPSLQSPAGIREAIREFTIKINELD